jgi:hypothetical protein
MWNKENVSMNLLRETAKRALTTYRTATSGLRLLPSFIIVGSARSGTTSLYNYLVQHPGISPALHKEIHFFDYNYQRGFSWYQGQFPALPYIYYIQAIHGQTIITGEASPYYLFHPYAPQRVAQLLPEIKLIALLRNPIERAFSHYCWEVDWGNEQLSFEDALEQEEKRMQGAAPTLAYSKSFPHLHFSYISRGQYAEQLERWFACFPQEQILIIKSEDMYNDPAAIFTQTLDFLHISSSTIEVGNCKLHFKTDFKRYNGQKSPLHKTMQPATRQLLAERFQPDNERLYTLLGRDFGWK